MDVVHADGAGQVSETDRPSAEHQVAASKPSRPAGPQFNPGTAGPGQGLLGLQRSAGNRAVAGLVAQAQPTVQRWPWSKKKKKVTVSGPTGGHTMTHAESGGVLGNAQLIKQYLRTKKRDAGPEGISDDTAEGVGRMMNEADLEASREPKRKLALEKGTGPGITDEAAEGVGRMFLRLEDIVVTLVDDKKPLTLSALKEPCDAASETERKEVYADKTLMARIEKKLPVRQYISFLGYLRVVEQPKSGTLAEGGGAKGGHTTAKDADAIIQDKMQAYVAEAVRTGKRVSGQVAVVNDADFRKAYLDEYGPTDLDVDGCNAFVRTRGNDGLIVIHAERGNAGTTIHEGMHKYSEPLLQQHVGFDFNEGVTEVLTRQITDNLPTPIARGNYQNQYLIMTKLKNRVSFDTLAKAYFNAKYDELVAAFKKSGKTEQQWADLIGHMKAKRFQDAYNLL